MKLMQNMAISGMALVLALASQAQGADLSGKVTLKGTPPAEKQLPINPSDPTCGKLHKTIPTTRFYLADKDGGLADVVVYVKQGVPTDKKFTPPAEPVVIDQHGCEFFPYVTAAMAGQKIHVKNSDPFMHNVNHAPVADIQKRPMNVAQMANGPIIERAFEKQTDLLVRFKCDVHPWMFSYVAILDHPYFAVTGKDGAFKIPNLPPGKYVVEAFHRKAGAITKEITMADDNQTLDFTLEVK